MQAIGNAGWIEERNDSERLKIEIRYIEEKLRKMQRKAGSWRKGCMQRAYT